MGVDRIELFTRLQPGECVARLSEAIDAERLSVLYFETWRGSKSVLGEVSESSLRLRKRIRYKNSFQTFLTATMKPMAEGTCIEGKFAMNPVVQVAMLIWFAFVTPGAWRFVRAVGQLLMNSGGSNEVDWMSIVLPPGMLAAGLAVMGVGRYFARNERQFLKDFLIRTLDAQPAERNTISVRLGKK
jgi:hypothetical protein